MIRPVSHWIRTVIQSLSQATVSLPVLIGVLVGFGIGNLLIHAVVTRLDTRVVPHQRWGPVPKSAHEYATIPDAVSWVVICPNCATPNDASYRYCRRCAEELPERPSHF